MATETSTIPTPPQILSWLRCTVGPGQFPDEYAIGGATFNGRPFSLYASLREVRLPVKAERGEGAVRVTIIEEKEGLALVKLPDESFEGATAYITVRADQLVA